MFYLLRKCYLGKLVTVAYKQHTSTLIYNCLVGFGVGELEWVWCVGCEVELSYDLILGIIAPPNRQLRQ